MGKKDTNVTRITANTTGKAKASSSNTSAKKAAKAKKIDPAKRAEQKHRAMTAEKIAPTPTKNIFKKIGRYFSGSWLELMQVHWPTRRATWGMTLAVLVYSIIFIVLILGLDALFGFISEQLIK